MLEEQKEKIQGELIHPLEEKKKLNLSKSLPILGAVLIILAGVITGFFLSRRTTAFSLVGGINEKPKIVKTEKTVGSTDSKTFRDQAEGVLEKGGFDGEGTHKLVRNPNDPSQTAYLTSTIVNLDEYVGKKVRVWGETFAAQKAGWLMDVGKIELLE